MTMIIDPFRGGSGGYTVTVGSDSETYVIDPKTPTTGTINADGYDDGTGGTFVAFGSIAPTSYSGHNISAMYHEDVNNLTVLRLDGDAHLLSPVLIVNGVNQNLGAGSYDGTHTTFQSTAPIADPFTAFIGSTVGANIA